MTSPKKSILLKSRKPSHKLNPSNSEPADHKTGAWVYSYQQVLGRTPRLPHTQLPQSSSCIWNHLGNLVVLPITWRLILPSHFYQCTCTFEKKIFCTPVSMVAQTTKAPPCCTRDQGSIPTISGHFQILPHLSLLLNPCHHLTVLSNKGINAQYILYIFKNVSCAPGR